jgi:hypothetical protein
MASDDFAPEEIDRLVKELATPVRPPAPRPTYASSADAAATQSTDPGAPAPGRPFTTARLIMPAARTEPKPSRTRAFASSIPMPALPKFGLPHLNDAQWGTLSTQLFVGLGVLLGAAMPFWPYAHAWSWGLLTYLAAVQLVVVTGVWGAKITWDARMPAAHTVALGTAIWGIGLLAAEAVPRIVYA